MNCLIKFPNNISLRNEVIYKHSADLMFDKACRFLGVGPNVIAVGSEKFKHLWKGEYWPLKRALAEKEPMANKQNTLIIGLDAPFLSYGSIKKFIQKCSQPDRKNSNIPFCTFRQTPKKKHPASMEHGGKVHCMISNGTLSINTGTNNNDCEPVIQDIFISYLNNEISINSNKNIRFTSPVPDRNTLHNIHDTTKSPNHDMQYSKDKNKYTVKITNDSQIVISEDLVEPQLYSQTHYTPPPLTIDGLIGAIENYGRINIQSGEVIHGRQAFPDIYEPFLGMIYTKNTELPEILSQSDKWLSSQKNLDCFMVQESEAKLISEDNLLIKYNLQDMTD